MMDNFVKVISVPTDINVKKLARQVLKNESRIIKKYPPKSIDLKEYIDGQTGLGPNSLTSRFSHYNLLNWWGTKRLKQWIRDGYEAYNKCSGASLYVQCWANVLRKGEQILSHKHETYNNTHPIHHLCGHLNVQVDGSTFTYYDNNPILNENGHMTFFSAYTYHYTDKYENDEERITIAFDIYSEEFYNKDIYDEFKYHWVKI